MKTRPAERGHVLPLKVRQVWVLFGVSLIVLAFAALLGTRPVHAQSACTSQQCGEAQAYAEEFCSSQGGTLDAFACPLNPPYNYEFFFECVGEYGVRQDYFEDCDSF
jgi:hypothetical protein